MKLAGAIVLCYLIGSIPFSYIFTRMLTKQDIRTRGSGNVGATNVLRTSGPWVALPALLGDVLKGVMAGFLTLYGESWYYVVFCPLATVFGHCYPLTLKLQGGKGVATAAGVLLVLAPGVCAIEASIFALVIAVSRYVSLGSVSAAMLLPVVMIIMNKPWPYLAAGSLMGILVVYRHRSNILRLRKGSEPKIGEKA